MARTAAGSDRRCHKREVVPGRNATRSELRKLAQLASSSFGHPTGTCRIGTDNMAVVDPELRVHELP